MKLLPMRFKGFEWHHNPAQISFECDKQVNELKSPNGEAYIQNMGRRNMKISGSGQLYGDDCLEQFDSLLRLFRQGGCGVLAIDRMEPIYAVFESVKILGQPKPDILDYSFVFREVMELKCRNSLCMHIAAEGENLWDISYRYSIPIDRLVELNPEVKRPDVLAEGFEVALC